MKIIETYPKAWQQKAPNTTIYAGLHQSPWGNCLVATIENNLALLIFWNSSSTSNAALTKYLKKYWGNTSNIQISTTKTQTIAQKAFKAITTNQAPQVNLFLKGTQFQHKIWKALLKIPHGKSLQYQDIARKIKHPKAIRAVGTAIGKNPILLYIPCHRVLPKAGGVGGYACGPNIKKQLLHEEGISYN